MSWHPSNTEGNESGKCRWDVVPYMRGECLDLGCGPYKVFPHFIGVDSGKDTELFGIQMKPDVNRNVADMKGFSSGFYDCVFSSHTLEHMEDYKACLKEWWRLVKVGGYLILYLPHKDFYPQCSKSLRQEWQKWEDDNLEKYPNRATAVEAYADLRRARGVTKIGEIYGGSPWANPDHKHDFLPEDIVSALKSLGGGFDVVECEERNGNEEYSFWMVLKKLSKGVQESYKRPKPGKTCAVIRYGAIGDNIQASTVFPWLKSQGFHITFYCQAGQGYEAIKHDPNIDRFVIQERNGVPASVLGEFWEHEKKKYTKWINFCESVEGTLLACPDRVQFEWPNELRAKYLDRNYLEWMHELAEVPPPYDPKFYSTAEERKWALAEKGKMARRVVLWSLAGSSGHKMWPHIDSIIAGVMLQYKDVDVVLVGDESCQILELGWEKEKRVHKKSAKWSIRQSLAFAEISDLIIGTETGLLNAAGGMDVPKIVNLSHSSEEMLTKYWKRTIALRQDDVEGKCNKQPCRQLHGSGGFPQWLDCPQHKETGAALCQFHISPKTMWAAVEKVLGKPVQLEKGMIRRQAEVTTTP